MVKSEVSGKDSTIRHLTGENGMKWWDQGLSKSPKGGCFRKWQVNLWTIFVLIPSSVSPASSFAQVTVRHFPAMCKPRKIHLRSRTIRWNHEQLLERNTQSFFWSVRKVLRSCEVSLTSKWGLLMRGLLQLGCFWKLLKLSFSSRNLQILWIRIWGTAFEKQPHNFCFVGMSWAATVQSIGSGPPANAVPLTSHSFILAPSSFNPTELCALPPRVGWYTQIGGWSIHFHSDFYTHQYPWIISFDHGTNIVIGDINLDLMHWKNGYINHCQSGFDIFYSIWYILFK